MKNNKYAFEELDGLANMPIRGRWSVDRVEVFQGALRLAIKHARQDIRIQIEGLRVHVEGLTEESK